VEVEIHGWIWKDSTAPLDIPREAPAGEEVPPIPESPAEPRPEATLKPRPLSRSTPILDTPGGTSIGQALLGGHVVPVAREGKWVKIRLEGWIPEGALEGSLPRESESSIAAVRRDPEAFRGKSARWKIQFIALERADRVRTDFREGEAYLLARDVGADRDYVYVAVPESLVKRFEAMRPFTILTVEGTIRTGRSSLVGNPILDLEGIVEEDSLTPKGGTR